MLTRFDGTVENYNSFDRLMKNVSREDLEDTHRIGAVKYGNQKGKSTAHDMVVEWLNIMFIPEFKPDRQDKFSPVWKWEIFDNGIMRQN